MSAADGLGPLPEAVHHWRTDVPGRAGPLLAPLFTASQMRTYAAEQVAAERERLLSALHRMHAEAGGHHSYYLHAATVLGKDAA